VRGVEGADSWVTDGHKWLNVPYDCGMVICRHPDALRGAMGIQAAYMPGGDGVPTKDLVLEFSRRPRGITVWAALRTLGRSGVAEMVERSCAHARWLAEGLRGLGWEVRNEVVLNQIVASYRDPETTARIRDAVERSGEAWFGTTHWQGRPAVRFSVSSWATTDVDIERTLDAIEQAMAAVDGELVR
jgi:glutamate/tyrosine decarboxylase-like PLP-dependent enzyme